MHSQKQAGSLFPSSPIYLPPLPPAVKKVDRMKESIKTEQIKELLRASEEPKVMLSVATPSATYLYIFQNLNCQFVQDTCIIVGVLTAIGLYFAIKSAIEKHQAKKVAIERDENILNLHEGIRNRKKG